MHGGLGSGPGLGPAFRGDDDGDGGLVPEGFDEDPPLPPSQPTQPNYHHQYSSNNNNNNSNGSFPGEGGGGGGGGSTAPPSSGDGVPGLSPALAGAGPNPNMPRQVINNSLTHS